MRLYNRLRVSNRLRPYNRLRILGNMSAYERLRIHALALEYADKYISLLGTAGQPKELPVSSLVYSQELEELYSDDERMQLDLEAIKGTLKLNQWSLDFQN